MWTRRPGHQVGGGRAHVHTGLCKDEQSLTCSLGELGKASEHPTHLYGHFEEQGVPAGSNSTQGSQGEGGPHFSAGQRS